MWDPPSQLSVGVWMSLIDNVKSLSIKVFQSMTSWDQCWHSSDTFIITIKPFTLIIVLHLSLCEIQLCLVNEAHGFSDITSEIQLRGTRETWVVQAPAHAPSPLAPVLERLIFLHETSLEYKIKTKPDWVLPWTRASHHRTQPRVAVSSDKLVDSCKQDWTK